MIQLAWGEVREGLSGTKPQLGFESQEAFTNWTKREMASQPEERAWAEARRMIPHDVSREWHRIQCCWHYQDTVYRQNRTESKEAQQAGEWCHPDLCMVHYRDSKKSTKWRNQISDLQKFPWLQGVGPIRWNQQQRGSLGGVCDSSGESWEGPTLRQGQWSLVEKARSEMYLGNKNPEDWGTGRGTGGEQIQDDS